MRVRGQWCVALTLVRAVGWLSRDDVGTRPGGAGERIETPEAQCLRELAFEVALMPHGVVDDAAIAREARRFVDEAWSVQVSS